MVRSLPKAELALAILSETSLSMLTACARVLPLDPLARDKNLPLWYQVDGMQIFLTMPKR